METHPFCQGLQKISCDTTAFLSSPRFLPSAAVPREEEERTEGRGEAGRREDGGCLGAKHQGFMLHEICARGGVLRFLIRSGPLSLEPGMFRGGCQRGLGERSGICRGVMRGSYWRGGGSRGAGGLEAGRETVWIPAQLELWSCEELTSQQSAACF